MEEELGYIKSIKNKSNIQNIQFHRQDFKGAFPYLVILVAKFIDDIFINLQKKIIIS